jgi:hypothetical protein
MIYMGRAEWYIREEQNDVYGKSRMIYKGRAGCYMRED